MRIGWGRIILCMTLPLAVGVGLWRYPIRVGLSAPRLVDESFHFPGMGESAHSGGIPHSVSRRAGCVPEEEGEGTLYGIKLGWLWIDQAERSREILMGSEEPVVRSGDVYELYGEEGVKTGERYFEEDVAVWEGRMGEAWFGFGARGYYYKAVPELFHRISSDRMPGVQMSVNVKRKNPLMAQVTLGAAYAIPHADVSGLPYADAPPGADLPITMSQVHRGKLESSFDIPASGTSTTMIGLTPLGDGAPGQRCDLLLIEVTPVDGQKHKANQALEE